MQIFHKLDFFQCICHLNPLVNSNLIWACNEFYCACWIKFVLQTETKLSKWTNFLAKFWVVSDAKDWKKRNFCAHINFRPLWTNFVFAFPFVQWEGALCVTSRVRYLYPPPGRSWHATPGKQGWSAQVGPVRRQPFLVPSPSYPRGHGPHLPNK